MTAVVATDVRVIKQPCDVCAGYGYTEDGATCTDCGGNGMRAVRLVPCPTHQQLVAWDPDRGGLLGQCDGCAAEAAHAIQILTLQSQQTRGGAV